MLSVIKIHHILFAHLLHRYGKMSISRC